jgi:DNA replication protein DnaC
MKIQSMFQKDINRDINGVIKVAQDDEQSLKQELEEYIITRELRRHFNTFFDNYSKAIDQPTDKIGAWISGFFGSGKSHLLKMLSYLLSNREVDGKRAVEYFKDKFDDPMMYATVVRCR